MMERAKVLIASRLTWCIVSAFVGVLVGILVSNSEYVEVARTPVSVDGIVHSLATVLARMLIGFCIQRAMQNDQMQKAYLMQKLSALLENANDLKEKGQSRRLSDMAATFKTMNIAAMGIRDVVKKLDRRCFAVGDFDFTNDIQELRRIATDTPIREIEEHAENSECSAKVRDGIKRMADKEWKELVARISNLGTRIVTAQTCVMTA